MASPALRNSTPKTRSARRILVQPVLPVFPLKPKPKARQAASKITEDRIGLSNGEDGVITASGRPEEATTSTILHSADKESVLGGSPTPAIGPLPEALVVENNASSESGSSSHTQKAYSAPEPTSTPASEITNPSPHQVTLTADSVRRLSLRNSSLEEDPQDADGSYDRTPSSPIRSPSTLSFQESKSSKPPEQPSGQSSSLPRSPALSELKNVSHKSTLDSTPSQHNNHDEVSNSEDLPETFSRNSTTSISGATAAIALLELSASSPSPHPPDDVTKMKDALSETTTTTTIEPRTTPSDFRELRIGSFGTPSALPEVVEQNGHDTIPGTSDSAVSGRSLHSSGYTATPGVPAVTHYQQLETSTNVPSNSFLELKYYLFQLYQTRQGADLNVVIGSTMTAFGNHSHLAHGFILCRSPVLGALVFHHQNQQVAQLDGSNILITLPKAIEPGAFEAALNFLYTDAYLGIEEIGYTYPLESVQPSTRVGILGFIVSYGLVAVALEIFPVQEYSFRLLANLMDWDVAEAAVREAIDIRALATQETTDENLAENVLDTIKSDQYLKFADSILATVFNFVVRRWDLDLDLGHFTISSSQSEHLRPDLPVTVELNSYLRHSNPVLQRMTFGSMPTSTPPSTTNNGGPAQPNTVISAILLSLPFSDLEKLYRLLKAHLMHTQRSYLNSNNVFSTILQERERRRQIVLCSGSVPARQRDNTPSNRARWEVVGWQEVMQSEGNETVLRRLYSGYLDPRHS